MPIRHNRTICADTHALKANRFLFKEVDWYALSLGANCLGTADIASGSLLLILGKSHLWWREDGCGECNPRNDLARKDDLTVAHSRARSKGY